VTRCFADQFVRCFPVEVDQVGDIGHLGGGLGANLPGLRLHRRGDPVLIVEQPVAKLAELAGASLVAEPLPCGLVGAYPGNHLADPLGAVDRERADHGAVGGVVHLEALASLACESLPNRVDRHALSHSRLCFRAL
jgi:hypothetical protein